MTNTEQLQESLYSAWEKRNPRFEKDFEESVIRKIADYGVGASALTESKGKILGAGYEPYILAFFLGLYENKRLPLEKESKVLGQPIQFWGNLDSKKGRQAYSSIRPFIFSALVARTDIDLLELDKGTITLPQAVSMLVNTMEEYANYGFRVMEGKLNVDPSYFFNQTSFLDLFLALINQSDSSSLDELEEI